MKPPLPAAIAPWLVLPSPQLIVAEKSSATAEESVVLNVATATGPVGLPASAGSAFTVSDTGAGATTQVNVSLAVPPSGSVTVTVTLVVPVS